MPYSLNVRRDSQSGKGSHLGELELIRRIRARAGKIRSPQLRLGIGDDCALLRPRPGEDLAITTDLSIAGRHFELGWHPAESVGHRALARGLSDLAAMGARPLAAFLSLGLPRELAPASAAVERRRGGNAPAATWLDSLLDNFVDRFFDGFLSLAKAVSVPLAGGDLAESPVFAADVTLVGAVGRDRALLRSGARAGHLLYVTGALGGAAAGLEKLSRWAKQNSRGAKQNSRGTRGSIASAARIRLEPAIHAHLYPQPRLKQGQWLAARRAATAAIDISDGLSTDLAHLCEQSGVAAEIDAARLPIHPGANLEQALHGGEDYELLFTAAPSIRLPRVIAGIPVTQIGRIAGRNRRRPQIALVTGRDRLPLEPRGWQHFARREEL